jgi:hypothetical protein
MCFKIIGKKNEQTWFLLLLILTNQIQVHLRRLNRRHLEYVYSDIQLRLHSLGVSLKIPFKKIEGSLELPM